MPGTKRQFEDLIPEDSEEGAPAKRQRVVQPGDFDSLPNELQLAVVREIANQPNRRHAHDELATLLRVNKHVNELILQDKDLEESVVALRRNPNIESRYIAVCHDVVNGISVEDALRQNSPLLKADELQEWDVHAALEHATPEHLADLAAAFSAPTDPASKKAFTGVALAAAAYGPEDQLNSADIDDLSRLAGAFTKNNLHLKDDDVATAVEAVIWQVAERGDNELLPRANIQQIATLAGAFSRHRDFPPDMELLQETLDNAMEALARRVTAHDGDLLLQASAEQLATVKAAFTGVDELDCRTALAKVAQEITKRDEARLPPHDTQGRPQLDNRERKRSVER